MGSNKLPYFPFHADDYLNDHAVMAMDADAEGCFIRLLARSWCNSTPGIIPEELVPEMSGLHRITDALAPDCGIEACAGWDGNGHRRRLEIMAQMEKAFDVSIKPGYWVQKRMVREHTKLVATLDARRKGAQATNAHRHGHWSQTDTVSGRSPTEEVEVEVDIESKDLSTSVDVRGGSLKRKAETVANLDPNEKTWVQMFDWFWGAYPKKVGKPAALRAWKAVKPQGQETIDAMDAGLERWEKHWEEKDRQFIPLPATFLNQRRWEDLP